MPTFGEKILAKSAIIFPIKTQLDNKRFFSGIRHKQDGTSTSLVF
jgi:hypothetical protein